MDVSKEITSEYERLRKHGETHRAKKIRGLNKRLSAAGRAAIIKGAKKRWAKVRQQTKRAVS